nr:hypothetical protein LSAT_0X38260 [Ipomoea trifida]
MAFPPAVESAVGFSRVEQSERDDAMRVVKWPNEGLPRFTPAAFSPDGLCQYCHPPRWLQNEIQERCRVLNLFFRSVRTLDPARKEACIRAAR